jgi:hypothetical protein
MVLEPRNVGSNALHHDGGEQRLLFGKAGVNGRLAGTGARGDLIHTGTSQPPFKKDAARRIEDAGLYLAGELARRASRADRTATSGAPLRRCHPGHRSIFTFARPSSAGLVLALRAD